MTNNPLKIVQTENTSKRSDIQSRQEEQRVRFEKMWKENPEQFNPKRSSIERLRIKKISKYIDETISKEANVLDLGCGYAPFTETFLKKTNKITLSDITPTALEQIPNNSAVKKVTASLPQTKLEDQGYDLILCCELLALLHTQDLRLSISELCRILKGNGTLLLSTDLDIHSEDALHRLKSLVETEFKIQHTELTYQSWLIHVQNFFKAPKRFLSAMRDESLRQKEIKNRYGFSKAWFRFSSSKPLAPLYYPLSLLFYPFDKIFSQSEAIAHLFEVLCRTFSPVRGMSHALLVCSRRPLFEESDEPAIPDRAPFIKERKWE